jgi:hypothetical protein
LGKKKIMKKWGKTRFREKIVEDENKGKKCLM